MYVPKNDEEKAYLAKYDPNKWPKPSVTVDLIVYIEGEGLLQVKRGNYPYKDYWALPGGFLDVGKENTVQAALRELKEETSLDLTANQLTLVGVYSNPDRDPRDHVVSIVYAVTLPPQYINQIKAGDDAKETRFVQLNRGPVTDDPSYSTEPPMAFDHNKIVSDYVNKVMADYVNTMRV